MKIAERPNALFTISAVVSVLALIPLPSRIHDIFVILTTMAWSAWGYDETKYGDNKFRHALGIFALVVVFLSLYHYR